MNKLSKREAMSAQKEGLRLAGAKKPEYDAELARTILQEDLGAYAEVPFTYHLDDDTRDRLIAHARQDAAHAVILATRTEARTRNILWLLAAGMVILLLLVVTPL